MKKIFILFFTCISIIANAQNLIMNGSFEYNNCQLMKCGDLSNTEYNQMMDSSISFGYNQTAIQNGDIDLFSGGIAPFTGYPDDTVYAQDQDWFIQIGNFGNYYLYPTILDTTFVDTLYDAFSLQLSDTLIKNKWFKLSFYFRKGYRPGLPTVYHVGIGRLKVGVSNYADSFGVLIDTSIVCDTIWLKQSFTFQATDTFRHISCQAVHEERGINYLAVDNFTLVETTEPLAIIENKQKRKLLKIVDVLGREILYKKNTPLFYLYDDGTVEKKIVVK